MRPIPLAQSEGYQEPQGFAGKSMPKTVLQYLSLSCNSLLRHATSSFVFPKLQGETVSLRQRISGIRLVKCSPKETAMKIPKSENGRHLQTLHPIDEKGHESG